MVLALAAVAVVALVILGNGPRRGGQSGGPPSDGTTSGSVSIANMAFGPTPLTVSVGTTVTWTNNDGVTHTVTSTSGPSSFSSGLLTAGSTFSPTFDTAGAYDHICTIRPHMQAKVVVT